MALQIREVNRIFQGQAEELKAFSPKPKKGASGFWAASRSGRLEDTLLMMSDAHTVLKGASKRIAMLFVDPPPKKNPIGRPMGFLKIKKTTFSNCSLHANPQLPAKPECCASP
jgi:hypothetical protein